MQGRAALTKLVEDVPRRQRAVFLSADGQGDDDRPSGLAPRQLLRGFRDAVEELAAVVRCRPRIRAIPSLRVCALAV